jgi:hypothetical protein
MLASPAMARARTKRRVIRAWAVASALAVLAACTSVSPPTHLLNADASAPTWDGPDPMSPERGAVDRTTNQGDATRETFEPIIADGAMADGPMDGPIPDALADQSTGDLPPDRGSPDAPGPDRPSCGDTKTDPSNCGACGHDCLPGATCQAGHCQPAVVLESSEDIVPFALDDEFFYFARTSSGLSTVLRIAKQAVRATPATIATGLTVSTFIGVVGSQLFWNERMADGIERGVSCQRADCASTISRPFGQGEELVRFNSVIGKKVATAVRDNASGTAKFAWYSVMPTGVIREGEFRTPPTEKHDFYTNGDSLCWASWPAGADPENAAGSLYATWPLDDTQQPAKLAGGLIWQNFIIDVNRTSVLLISISDGSLCRVPLPLGLGAKSPQLLTRGVQGMAATEDEKGITWFDSNGTLNRCVPDNCDASQTVLAVGQSNAHRLFQDDGALYWVTSSPFRILRLAK